jgi:hypothetical protein
VLSAMQSSMRDKTGLIFFPGLGVGKNAKSEEKSEAMKQMQQRIVANPSGSFMYHPRGQRVQPPQDASDGNGGCPRPAGHNRKLPSRPTRKSYVCPAALITTQ